LKIKNVWKDTLLYLGIFAIIGIAILAVIFGNRIQYRKTWEPMVESTVERILREKGLTGE